MASSTIGLLQVPAPLPADEPAPEDPAPEDIVPEEVDPVPEAVDMVATGVDDMPAPDDDADPPAPVAGRVPKVPAPSMAALPAGTALAEASGAAPKPDGVMADAAWGLAAGD